MKKNFYNLLDNIVKENKIYRLKEELNDTNISKDRFNYLNELLKKEEEIIFKYVEEENKIKKHIDKLKDNHYKKIWRCLTDEQKEIKLNEYIKNKNIVDEKILEQLKTISNKQIVYDKYNGIISEIKLEGIKMN